MMYSCWATNPKPQGQTGPQEELRDNQGWEDCEWCPGHTGKHVKQLHPREGGNGFKHIYAQKVRTIHPMDSLSHRKE